MKFGKFNVPVTLHARKESHGNHNNKDQKESETETETESIHSTYSRLLDKLQLGDDEWDYDVDTPNTSTGSEKTIHIVRSQKKSNTQISNSKPADQFRSLKKVMNRDVNNNANNSYLISKALQDADVTVNSVHQNKSVYVSRDQVKSIHLDDLLNVTDNESTMTDDDNGDDHSSITDHKPLYEDILNTPTKQSLDLTPIGSPNISLQATPNQLSHTPTLYSPIRHPYYQRTGHSHTDSTGSTASAATAPMNNTKGDKKREAVLDNLMRSASLPSNNNNRNSNKKSSKSPKIPLPLPPDRSLPSKVTSQQTPNFYYYQQEQQPHNSQPFRPTNQLKSPFVNPQQFSRPQTSPTLQSNFTYRSPYDDRRYNNQNLQHYSPHSMGYYPQHYHQPSPKNRYYQQYPSSTSPPPPHPHPHPPTATATATATANQYSQNFNQSVSRNKNAYYGDVDLSNVLPR